MAKKKNHKSATGKGKPQAPAVPGGASAFLGGLAGSLALLALAAPWTSDGTTTVYGFQLFGTPSSLPEKLAAELSAVGGRAFMVAYALVASLGVALGFGWKRVLAARKTWVTEGLVIYVPATFGVAISLMLTMLEMNLLKITAFGAHAAWASVAAVGLFALLSLRALDQEAGRTEGALEPSDWGIWVGGLAFTAVFHYWIVCYRMILRAPEALMSRIGRLG